jgi:hypothetical protein
MLPVVSMAQERVSSVNLFIVCWFKSKKLIINKICVELITPTHLRPECPRS